MNSHEIRLIHNINLRTIPFILNLMMLCVVSYAQEKDVYRPLPPGHIKLYGFLQNDLENSLIHWNMGVVPYAAFVDIFRNGRTFFAQGEMWGKAVRSGCLYYRYTQNPVLKQKLRTTVYDLIKLARPNGCISATDISHEPGSSDGDIWERSYVLLGLEAYYDWVEKDDHVLYAMKNLANCTISQIGPFPKIGILDLGWSPNHIESSTILLPILRLYEITGDSSYLKFDEYIIKEGGAKGYNLIEQAINNILPYKMGGVYPKAYEMTLFFEGLLEYYRISGNTKILRAVKNYYYNVKEHEITIIGNGGGDYPYHPDFAGETWDNTAYEQTNPAIQRMMETCTGVTWEEFCGRLFSILGIPSAIDMMERYIYNGLIGSIKPDGSGFSYVNLLNGIKTNPQGWGGVCNGVYCTCCNLNGPLGLAYIPYYSIMRAPDGVAINLFNQLSADYITPLGHQAKINVISNFPISNQVNIFINIDTPEKFNMYIRIPSWSSNTVLKVNKDQINPTPGSYQKVNKVWRNGDRIYLKLDMRCRLVHDSTGKFQALIRGPIVLTRDEHIDQNYNKPVGIKSNHGIVDIYPEIPNNSLIRMQFSVPTTNGTIHMIDYASGYSWDGKRIQTWMPIKYNR